ncbi:MULTISPECIES: Na+/H+ antiporter NhaA [unclassified Motilimonas]|uniref:Na+/H+ antiporter NhaA n=1 Tax=Motilimonas TaxID=1914248 RepID=UPI001E50D8E4|nr:MULTISPECIES: Na+/H+ antiporter NhaA [unclassified Motilimonas]MCE0559076.1 Na+/H+ antiporter NhaA [Motilimonas sp. E26]MDO6527539.1 Na+/H+ antiporter NhaA [Motilimonas sp. 1_MG-2023]
MALKQFFKQESAPGIILIFAALTALLIANSPLTVVYQDFLDMPVQLRIAALDIDKPLLLWINDGLMAIFFLLIGLEVKRELVEGDLSTREKAMLPAIAAIGGMLVPAAVFLLFNFSDPVASSGWAIPAATDIAFALGVLALFGKRVPVSLKVFLLALAIIDDLGVIVIIALFYSADLSLTSLLVAALSCALLFAMSVRGERRMSLYMLVGLVLWVAVLKSGVHATLAGVVLGFAIPLRNRDGVAMASKLEHNLHPWCSFMILPLFAFANAGVSLAGIPFSAVLQPLPMGIILGLLIGKPLGVFTMSYLAVKMGWASLPKGINFMQIFAVSILCGIGFTMSIFITSLAFSADAAALGDISRLAILIGSAIAALLGYLTLHFSLAKESNSQVERSKLSLN